MSRITIAVLLGLLVFGLWSVAARRGSNKELAAYLGMWSGQLSSDKIAMKGYLRIKGTHKQFEIHLEGAQQTIDIVGSWSLKDDHTLVLQTGDVTIDDFGGAAKRDPNKPYIDNQQLRNAFSKPLVMNLSASKERLTSLPLLINSVRHMCEFERTFGNVR